MSASISPVDCAACSIACRHNSAFASSTPIASVFFPPPCNSDSSFRAASSSRSMTTVCAPSSAAARMIAAPMPLAPPVTTTVLPLSSKSIEASSVQAEDLLFCFRRKFPSVVVNHGFHASVASRQQAHRPIRTEHDPINAKAFEDCIQVRLEVLCAPVLPVSFRNQARDFAIDLRERSECANGITPAIHDAIFDCGLADVVKNETLLGKFLNQLHGCGK